jgi:hypothetical protein
MFMCIDCKLHLSFILQICMSYLSILLFFFFALLWQLIVLCFIWRKYVSINSKLINLIPIFEIVKKTFIPHLNFELNLQSNDYVFIRYHIFYTFPIKIFLCLPKCNNIFMKPKWHSHWMINYIWVVPRYITQHALKLYSVGKIAVKQSSQRTIVAGRHVKRNTVWPFLFKFDTRNPFNVWKKW